MKQLNNNNNGKIIKIIDVNISQNKIKYNILEYGESNSIVSTESHKFTSINLEDYLYQSVNFYELCLDTLKTEKETDYTLSSDLLNWCILENIEKQPTTLRAYLPSLLLGREVNTTSPLGILIESMRPYDAQLQRLEDGNMQYLAYITEQAKAILESYISQGVIIQYK